MFCRSLVLSFLALSVHSKPVQLANLQLPSTAAANKQAVVDLFSKSYAAYRQYAWGHDDLLPISESYSDGRNGWGSTMVDALDTMVRISFEKRLSTSQQSTSTSRGQMIRSICFETTIRYVGGLLSAYELSGKQYDVLVQKAEQLGEGMAYAWIGNNVLPYNAVNFTYPQTHHRNNILQTGIAAAGTLDLEWSRLSLYTNNDTYRKLAEGAMEHMIDMPTPLPGMPGQLIDPATGDPADSYVTWGGGSDSYFEYLIKYARLTNADDNYADAWLEAVDSSMKVLLETSTIDNWVYLADYDDNKRSFMLAHIWPALLVETGFLVCGKLANNDTIVDIGLKLTDACWNTYASTATGIGPEGFAYISKDGSYTGDSAPTTDEIQFYSQHGFYITEPDYILRPEVLESNFYAWRTTGDTKYLDNAASAIKSFQRYLPATVAYSGIDDVNNATSTKIDDMESFWFAEVLKYLYLTFDDPNNISLDDYVFNTECHPFKAPTAKSIYGTVV
ncbi:glycoside hydrolase family 47 protein [Chiua virens]|nr:glycoside hydrolase family 47 protein [Chiua virens]